MGTEEQWVQRNSGYRGAEGTEVLRNIGYRVTEEHWVRRNSGCRGAVGTEVQRSKEHEVVTNNCCVNWTDFTGIKLPFNYKIQSLETEDRDALFSM